jgi:hypothetical protein
MYVCMYVDMYLGRLAHTLHTIAVRFQSVTIIVLLSNGYSVTTDIT